MDDIKKYIKEIEEELINIRRYIHQNAEVGFNLKNTLEFVKDKLYEYGYKPYECGKCGLIANINKNKSNTILLRADMDALPLKEESDIDFKSEINMHACGHDLHTTFLLGACKVLKKYEDRLNSNIRFMFQPAEEIFEGAKDMIADGALENVDEAYMIHVMAPTNFQTGTFVISDMEVTAPSCDYFNINVIGKSCHGAMPSMGIDPIIIASNIISSLKHIETNELDKNDEYILTFGSIIGGNTHNIIPDEVKLKGSLRTFNEKVRSYAKNRIVEISNHIAKAYNGSVEISFPTSAPVLVNDSKLVNVVYSLLKENELNVYKVSELNNTLKGAGSEDFAYVSSKVPSLMINLAAGQIEEGYQYPLHNSKVVLDEKSIYYGVLLLVTIALKK